MTGRQVGGREDAEAVAEELREQGGGRTELAHGGRAQPPPQKCILDMSPEAERLIGGEFRLHIVALDEEGRLVRCSVTTVSRKATRAR